MRVVVYTCIYGEYESVLRNHRIVDTEEYQFDFICFTDQTSPTFKYCDETWNVVVHCPCDIVCQGQKHSPNLRQIHNTVLARCCPLEMPGLLEYDAIVYIDANAEIVRPQLIVEILDKRMDTDDEDGPLVVFSQHPWRNCYKAEAKICLTVDKFKNTDLEKQISQYETEGMPDNAGLFWNGFQILLHPKSAHMQQFYDCYKRQLFDFVKDKDNHYHAQGQVALPYVLWKCDWLLPTQSSHHRLAVLPQLFRDRNNVVIYQHGVLQK